MEDLRLLNEVSSYPHPSTSYKTTHIACQSPEIAPNSNNPWRQFRLTQASAYVESFGPVVVVVNIPLVDRLIGGTCEARDAEGRRYFEVQGKVE